MNVPSLMRGQSISVSALILQGSRWTARSIRNPYLQTHARVLSRMVESDRGKAAPLLPALGRIVPMVELRTPLLTQVRRGVLNSIPVLIRLAAHRRDWIREPETWQPDLGNSPREILVSLVEHLLSRYPLPQFCENAWFIDGPLAHIERDWYVHLARGGSLRTFPGWVPPHTRRAAHEFLSAPAPFQMREALRYGQAQAILGDRDLSCAVAKSRIGLDFRNDALWIPFFGMWASSERDPESLFLVADYLWAMAQEKSVSEIGLAGRPFACLLRSAKRFFHGLATSVLPVEGERIPQGPFDAGYRNRLLAQWLCRWEPLDGIHPFRMEKFGWRWEVAELTSQSDLSAEGRDMAHCVGGYTRECRSGESSIFSLRSCEAENGILDREVTVEVSREKRRLVQARAWRNRHPHPAARRILLEWCGENRIDAGALRSG